MNWTELLEDGKSNHRTSRFNKEKFCKKNKIGSGKYGSHVYVNNYCKFCSKKSPSLKYLNINEEKTNG